MDGSLQRTGISLLKVPLLGIATHLPPIRHKESVTLLCHCKTFIDRCKRCFTVHQVGPGRAWWHAQGAKTNMHGGRIKICKQARQYMQLFCVHTQHYFIVYICFALLLLGVRTYRNGIIAGKGGEHVRELNGTLLHSTRATQPMRICGVLIKKEVAGIFRKKKDDTIVLFSRGCLLLRY